MMMKIAASEFPSWIARPPRYSVLFVKMDGCIPCGRVAPLFKKLHVTHEHLAHVQFATCTLTPFDRKFAEAHEIKSTPTFQVYDGEEKVFQISSVARFPELKKLIDEL